MSVVWLPGCLQVLKLVSSPQGVVPAGGVAVLRFEFRPLEAKLHEVTLPVKLADGQLEHLRVVGRGYHPEHGLQAVPVPPQVSLPSLSVPHTVREGCGGCCPLCRGLGYAAKKQLRPAWGNWFAGHCVLTQGLQQTTTSSQPHHGQTDAPIKYQINLLLLPCRCRRLRWPRT